MNFSGEIKAQSIGTKLYCTDYMDNRSIDTIDSEFYEVKSYYKLTKDTGESYLNKLDLTHYLYSDNSNNLPHFKNIGTIQTFTDDQNYSDAITLEFKKDSIGYYFEVVANDATYNCKLSIICDKNYICQI